MTQEEEVVARYLGLLKDAKKRVVGVRAVTKVLRSGQASAVFVAKDADEKVVSEVIRLCQQDRVPLIRKVDKDELGQACRIEVSAAAAALIEK